ncbi:MAG TPA: biotin/lipoyl-binding protein, partial [Gemmatimonadales bacterium]|nr:biotin/lipoyl-binding protein [Gemmatimonadales bacterium]
MKALFLITLILAGTAGGAFVLRRPTAETPPARLQVAVVTERDFSPQVLATGFIRLLPGARIAVGARVSGVVVSLPVTQGSRVEQDDTIARLDDREARSRLAQAEAAFSELDALLRQREDDLSRAESLRQAGGSTEQEILNAGTALVAARARLDGARANRELALLQ